MTDILCNWLNLEVKLDIEINPENFAETFSSGYVIGQILQKYELLDDFDQLIDKNSSDAKLNNFLVLEPILKLIGVSFNNEIAHDVMAAKSSVLINLMYQLFIILERKKKSNITALGIKTMQAPAVTKFQEMETQLFQEKLKRTTPRQSDLNMQQAIHKYKEHQFNMKLKAERDRILSAEGHKSDTQQHRKQRLDRSKYLQQEQEEQRRKIDAAVVQIPKPPPSKTLAAINQKKKDRIRREAEKSLRELDDFENRKAMEVTRKHITEDSGAQEESYSRDESYSMSDTTSENGRLVASETQNRQGTFLTSTTTGTMDQRGMVMEYLQPKSNEEYIGKIRSRLESDKEARVAREKRRRQVLMNCLKTHFEQEETERENMIAMRLLRQSQMERRIAVQLLQVRNEKTVMKNNRLDREQQYQQRREKEFVLAMDKEQEMLRQFRLENEDRFNAEMELYEEKRRQLRMSKYEKHYEMAQKIVYDLVEMGFNFSEFNMITDGNIPKKIIHDLKTSFIHAVPISSEQTLVSARSKPISASSKAVSGTLNDTKEEGEPIEEQEDLKIQIHDIEVTVATTPYTDVTSRDKFMQKMEVLDEEDFTQFKENLGEWVKQDENQPTINVILEWIIDKLAQSSAEFDENSKLPQLPAFPIKAAIVGKGFSGKTSVIEQLVKNNRCVSIVPQVVINEALEAFENEEEIEIKVQVVPETISEPKDPSDQNKLDDDKTENQITDINLNSSTNEMPVIKSDGPIDNKNSSTAQVGGETDESTNKVEEVADEDNYEIHMEPTKRAQIGQRIKNELMNGRPISDELLVEVILEYIERIPADQGWIIDDFPSTYNQAKLLEKSALRLSPTSAAAAAQSSARTSSRKGGKATPAPPKESLFDAVILLDTPDNDCLKRAMMCTEEYQADNNLEGEELNNSSNKRQSSSSKDVIANLQTSLSKFTEQWPKLFKFFTKIRNDLVITVNSSEQTNPTQVYLSVEEILDRFVENKKTPLVIETPEIIMEPTESAEPKTEEVQPEESSKLDDQHSKDVLTSKGGTSSKRKSRKSSGKSPRKGSKGSKGSSRASSAGSKASSTAKKSKKGEDKSEVSTTRKSRTKSRASSGEGKKTASGSGKKKSGSKSSSRSRSGSSKKGKKSKTPTTAVGSDEKKEEVVPSQPPTPMPGDPDWTFAEKPIEQNISMALLEFWNNLNSVYETNCKSVFREIRVDREDIIRYIYAIKSAFRQFLDRPDSKQDYLDQFQKEFNELAQDWRGDPEVIQEVHQQISELKLNLLEISQECHNMADTELESLKKNEWLQDKIGVVTNEYLNLFQHELDRYQDVTRLLRDYYGYLTWTANNNKDANSTKLDEFKPEFLRLPILDIPTAIEENQPDKPNDDNENKNLEQPTEPTNSQRQSANVKKENPASANKKGGKQVAANQNATNSGAEPTPTVDDETEKLFQVEVPMIEYNTQSPQIISTVISNAPTPAKPAAKGDKTAQPISLLKMLANLKPDKKDAKSATERDTTKTPSDLDEKLLYDATSCCVTIINQILEFETLLLNSKDDGNKSGDAKTSGDKGGAAAGKGGKEKGGKEKGGKKSRTPTPKKGGKDKGASTDKKGQKSRSPSARKGSGKGNRKKSGNKKSPTKEIEPDKDEREQSESPEDKENRLFVEKIKEEYIAALQRETSIVKSAIEHIMSKGIEHIHQLKEKIDGCYQLLSMWNADKLVNDEKSIKEIETVLRYHVEKHEPLKDKLQIVGNKFFINPIKEPDENLIPDVPDVPLDPAKPDEFSIHHLRAIYEMFNAASEVNSQQIPIFDFNRVMHQIFSSLRPPGFPTFIQSHMPTSNSNPQPTKSPTNKETATTPQPAPEPISSVLDQFSSMIGQEFSTDNEYINWKRFLLTIMIGNSGVDGIQGNALLSNRTDQDNSPTENTTTPLWPSISELLETLERFRVIDQRKSGIVTKEQYEFVDLWFSIDKPIENAEEQQLLNRNAEIKQLIFDVFKQTEILDDDLLATEHQTANQIEFIDYEDMLIQFGILCTQDYYEGLGRALSLVIDRPIPAEILENNDPRNKSNNTERGQESLEDFDVPINALFKILSLGHSNVRNAAEIDFNSADLEDNSTEQEILLLKTLQTIYDNCEDTTIDIATPNNEVSPAPNQSNIRSAKLQALLAQEGLWEWLHTCDWFKFVNLKSVIQKCVESNQLQSQPIGTASSAAE